MDISLGDFLPMVSKNSFLLKRRIQRDNFIRNEFWIDNRQFGSYQRQPQIISTPVICPYSILFGDSIGSGTVNITYSLTYEGPVVEGWPPDKDRYMPHYILPAQNTFSIQPPSSYFKDCKLMVAVQSRRESL